MRIKKIPAGIFLNYRCVSLSAGRCCLLLRKQAIPGLLLLPAGSSGPDIHL